MARVVTHDMLTETQEYSSQLITRVMMDRPADDKTLYLEANTIISIIAWEILVPIFVAITSAIGAHKFIKSSELKKKSIAQIKNELLNMVGIPIKLDFDNDNKEECIIIVQELLEPFQITRQQAREVVDLLLSKLREKE